MVSFTEAKLKNQSQWSVPGFCLPDLCALLCRSTCLDLPSFLLNEVMIPVWCLNDSVSPESSPQCLAHSKCTISGICYFLACFAEISTGQWIFKAQLTGMSTSLCSFYTEIAVGPTPLILFSHYGSKETTYLLENSPPCPLQTLILKWQREVKLYIWMC